MTYRNYHVFYYLLMGASRDEQEEFHLLQLQDYYYLNQVPLNAPPPLLCPPLACTHTTPISLCLSVSLSVQGDLHLDDDSHFGQYKRLQQAMEMVGFLASTKKQ